jgi:hypothetical protein
MTATRTVPEGGLRFVPAVYRYSAGVAEPGFAGSVLAYVLSGAVRPENSATGPSRVYRAGESLFEPPGGEHLVGGNAGATEPASLLAVLVAEDGARLTTFDH